MPSFPHNFDPSGSILFLGAGFSVEATNLLGDNPPSGVGLENKIKQTCELPSNDTSDLKDLSRYAVNNDIDLFEMLNNNYTVKRISKDQKSILGKNWLRIYTTNYDDCVEFFWNEDGNEFKKNHYSIESTIPKHIMQGDIIHLHGYIHHCYRENLLDQLVLSHFSYAQQRVLRSPWWHLFAKDLRVAKNIFFVGYELNDFEPAAYLSSSPDLASKTHFILRPTDSPVKANRLNEYGHRHDISTSGFASECITAVAEPRPKHANSLESFRYFDIHKDKKITIKPSVLEIQSLFSFGKFNIQRLISTYPDSEYVLIRENLLSKVDDAASNARTIIVHSKIGNGKTVFCQILAMSLSSKGYDCFEIKDNVSPLSSEIDFIRNTKKSAIIFPNYESAYNNMHLFSNMPSNFLFIVQMQTSTLQVRNSEVYENFINPIFRLNLNNLDKNDIQVMYKMLDLAGIAPSSVLKNFPEGGEIRDIVLTIFNHKGISSKIDKLLLPLLSKPNSKFVIMCSAILKSLGIATDPAFLRSVVQVDVFSALHESGESIHELLDFSYDSVEPHSALFSLFLVKRYLKAYETTGVVFRMASEAARIMNEDPNPQSERARSARATMGALLRFSALNELLEGHLDRTDQITNLYEHGRRDIHIQGEPLFWLQYSILMQNTGEWSVAEKHMETAYKRSNSREGFLTYQLDTNSFGLYLELEIRSESGTIERHEKIIDRLKSINLMIGQGNHRGHALRVLNKFEKFIDKKKTSIGRSDSETYIRYIDLIVASLSSIPMEERVFIDSGVVKLSLMRAKSALQNCGV